MSGEESVGAVGGGLFEQRTAVAARWGGSGRPTFGSRRDALRRRSSLSVMPAAYLGGPTCTLCVLSVCAIGCDPVRDASPGPRPAPPPHS